MSEEEEKSEFPPPEKMPEELQEMIDKLPTKFGEPNAILPPKYDIINDKDFSYKVLYCVDLNKTNPFKKIYNDIVSYYNINISPLNISGTQPTTPNTYTATFEEGFVVNAKIDKKGGTIATQKRRPKRQRKSNNTIRMRTR